MTPIPTYFQYPACVFAPSLWKTGTAVDWAADVGVGDPTWVAAAGVTRPGTLTRVGTPVGMPPIETSTDGMPPRETLTPTLTLGMLMPGVENGIEPMLVTEARGGTKPLPLLHILINVPTWLTRF